MTGPGPFTCEICGEEVPSEHGLKIHRGKKHPAAARPDDDGQAAGIDAESPYVDTANPETAPKQPTPAWRERIWGSNEPKQPRTKKTAGSDRRPRTRRQSTEGIWTTLWTGGGVALVRTGADVPVGNCLQFQAPIVGDILDEAIADTFLDRWLQPIAGSGERFKKVSTVLAMPVLVAALERSPGAAPILEPLLRQAIREHLVAMAPVIKARQKEEENYRKALAELGMDPAGDGDDPIDAVIDAIFPRVVPADSNGQATYATQGAA